MRLKCQLTQIYRTVDHLRSFSEQNGNPVTDLEAGCYSFETKHTPQSAAAAINGGSRAQVCLILNDSGPLTKCPAFVYPAVPSVCKTPRLRTLWLFRPTGLFSPPDWLPPYFCKAKARLSTSLIKHRVTRNEWNSKNIAPYIGISWTWEVSFTLRQIYLRESAPISHSIEAEWAPDPVSKQWRQQFLLCRKPDFPRHPSHSPVTTVSGQSQYRHLSTIHFNIIPPFTSSSNGLLP